MTHKSSIAALVLAACLAAPLAQADTHVLARAGAWEAFSGTTTEKGVPVCGISTAPHEAYFGLKNFHGNATFTIQISRKTWRVANGAKQKLTMRFDQQKVRNAVGSGFHFNDGDSGLEFRINKSELGKFMREFATAG
jgi:hypothetical protein